MRGNTNRLLLFLQVTPVRKFSLLIVITSLAVALLRPGRENVLVNINKLRMKNVGEY